MFHPFQVEQFLSENEQNAELHLAESGVHPMTLGEFMDVSGVETSQLRAVSLNYPEVNGTRLLRERIAALYPGATADNVLVTVGASEANHLVVEGLLQPGDRVVAVSPTYQQLPGNALNRSIRVDTVGLLADKGWRMDPGRLEAATTAPARMIHVVNPHNPTGQIMSETERASVLEAVERTGSWLVADEVYAGTERDTDVETPTFWGQHDRVIAINSMSKAYGLPGLRLGWVVAPDVVIEDLWRRHEYATISASMLGMTIAESALDPAVRPRIIERSRRLIRTGFEALQAALGVHPGVFSVTPPQASAMAFVRYELDVDSMTFAKRLLDEKGVLVVPGSSFGLDNHFRLSSALPHDYLADGLNRLNDFVGGLVAHA